jgi:hypothetical protein
MSNPTFAVGDRVITLDEDAQRVANGGSGPMLPVGQSGTVEVVRTSVLSDETLLRVAWDMPEAVPKMDRDLAWYAGRFAHHDPFSRFVPPARQVYIREGDTDPNTKVSLIGLGDGAWVKVRNIAVLEHGTSALESEDWRFREELSPDSFSRFVLSLAVQTKIAQEDAAAKSKAIAGHEAWVTRFTQAAHEYANNMDWCSEFDDFMVDHGLAAREQEFRVVLDAQVQIDAKVTAHSMGEALSVAAEKYGPAEVAEAIIAGSIGRWDLNVSDVQVQAG